MPAKKNTESITFEQSIAELEQIVDALESGEESLDETLALFERGVKLTASANAALDNAQQRVNVLLKSKDGEVKEEAFTQSEE